MPKTTLNHPQPTREEIPLQPLRVIISGGGTGGHIFPAIAIAKALKAKDPATEILFVGAQGRMEMEKVPAAGFPIKGLWISGLQRKLTPANLLFPVKVIKSLLDAWKISRDFRPDVAIGVGGYASGPLLFAASRMDVPCLIQEQNSYAGITNKWLSRGAEAICVAFDGMEKYFPAEKIIKTGNPVRSDILDIFGKRAEAMEFFGLNPNRKTLLVIGGSLGARTINESIHMGLDKLIRQDIQVIWQTGKYYAENARNLQSDTVKIMDFISRMDLAYAAADIVVSRAGALSVSELCITGKPTILVPSPNVAEDHQTKNALALVKRSAAILVRDTAARHQLVDEVMMLFNNPVQMKQLSENIRSMALPDATDRIVGEIYRIANCNV